MNIQISDDEMYYTISRTEIQLNAKDLYGKELTQSELDAVCEYIQENMDYTTHSLIVDAICLVTDSDNTHPLEKLIIVTQTILDTAIPDDYSNPVSLAVANVFPDANIIHSGGYIKVEYDVPQPSYMAELPKWAVQWLDKYFEGYIVEPISFALTFTES